MSDQPQPPQPSQSSGMSFAAIRQIVLVLLLMVFVAALAYDRAVARPGSVAAHEDLTAKMDAAEKEGERLDQAAVEKILSKAPAEVRTGKHYTWARYSWMAGAPWRHYDVWVVYQPWKEKLYCLDVELNSEPESFSLDYATPVFDPSEDNGGGNGTLDADSARSRLNQAYPGGINEPGLDDGPGGGRPDGGRPGGGRPGGGRPGGGRPDTGGRPPSDNESETTPTTGSEAGKETEPTEDDPKETETEPKETEPTEGDPKETEPTENGIESGS
ncbi:MAG: hypothetical protein ABGX22_26340 [Pirellulaceae bacterium]